MAQCQSFLSLYLTQYVYQYWHNTNIDLHFYIKRWTSNIWTARIYKLYWSIYKKYMKKKLRFLFKIIDDLQSSFRGLNILQISDMLAFKQSGEKLNCTFFNMIKLIKIVCILLGVEVFICWIKFKRHLLVHSNSDLMYCT